MRRRKSGYEQERPVQMTVQERIAKAKQDREAKAVVVNKILAGPSKKAR